MAFLTQQVNGDPIWALDAWVEDSSKEKLRFRRNEIMRQRTHHVSDD
jgi:hypothetical protein